LPCLLLGGEWTLYLQLKKNHRLTPAYPLFNILFGSALTSNNCSLNKFTFVMNHQSDHMNRKIVFLLTLICFSTFTSYSQSNDLYKTIVKLDSTFFNAYNTCDMATQRTFYSDSIEFFHDRSGLETSKEKILSATEKYICGKVTRELVQGSIEVSPLPGYGAVELGSHMFHNKQEPNAKSHPSKFVIIWKNTNGNWTITKVISLH